MVFSTLTYVLIKQIMCTEQYAIFKKLYEPKTKDSRLYIKGKLFKSKFHRSAQDRTPPKIIDRINV